MQQSQQKWQKSWKKGLKEFVHKYFIGFKYFWHFSTSKLRSVNHYISKTLVNIIIQSQNGEEGDKRSYCANLPGDNILKSVSEIILLHGLQNTAIMLVVKVGIVQVDRVMYLTTWKSFGHIKEKVFIVKKVNFKKELSVHLKKY